MIETFAIAYYGLGVVAGVGCLIYTLAQKEKEPKDDSYYLKKLKKESKKRGFDLCSYCSHHTAHFKTVNNWGNLKGNDEADCKTGKELLDKGKVFYMTTCKEFELDKNSLNW